MTPETLTFLACVAFLVGAVIAGLQKGWALMCIGIGLFLVAIPPLVR